MKNGTASAGTGVARRSRARISAFVALGAAAAIALAACGGSSDNSSSKKSTSTTKKSSGAAATAAVKTANSATLGTIVVTNDGKTVYTLTNAGQQVPCSGTCAMVWPAVSVAAGAKASGTGVKNVGTTASGQVTVNGAPVYTFQGDSAAGTTNGEGIMSFGGTWNVVKASGGSGSSSGGAPATTTPATTARSGSGY